MLEQRRYPQEPNEPQMRPKATSRRRFLGYLIAAPTLAIGVQLV